MTISLVALLEPLHLMPAANCELTTLVSDSRQVSLGAGFFAMPGLQVDGRDYISQALALGAAAVLYEADGWQLPAELVSASAVMVPVSQLQAKLGLLASRFYSEPSAKLTMLGVTGTNGKTSTSLFIADAMTKLGIRCGLIGTVGNGFVNQLQMSWSTTPDPIALHAEIARQAATGAAAIAMEASSHALDQGRVNGVVFDHAVFTNLSRDHFDYHGDMAAYFAAKAKLFDVESLQSIIINHDDDYGRRLLLAAPQSLKLSSYGLTATTLPVQQQFYVQNYQLHSAGISADVATPEGCYRLTSHCWGLFNLYNLLAALAALATQGLPAIDIIRSLASVRQAPGRMESFGGGGKPRVIIDYAHTPAALQQVLIAVHAHCESGPKPKIWCVFGCGGDRDKGKRAMMGRVAEQYVEHVVLTNDNPRTEDPVAIIADIRAGLQDRQAIYLPDRRAAIHHAIAQAGPADIVVVAGKGHETEQIIGAESLPFNDKEKVEEALAC